MSEPRWEKEEKGFAAELKRQLLYLSSFKLKGKKKRKQLWVEQWTTDSFRQSVQTMRKNILRENIWFCATG